MMDEILAADVEMLKKKYPTLQYGMDYAWIMIPDFILPEGYNRKTTSLLFLIPVSYPHTAPDNFYVEAGLKFSNGNILTNYTEGATVPVGGSWGCFSWHQESWAPSADTQKGKGDNLITFIKSVNIRLRDTS